MLNNHPKIFISYARSDGEDFARHLRSEIESAGLSVWQDRTHMEGGVDWWQQIQEALDKSVVMVLIATPAAILSPVVRKEWSYARLVGVWIYPVIVPGNPPDFKLMPRWMHSVHFYDYNHPEQHALLLQHLKEVHHRPPRVPFMATEKPVDFVSRPQEMELLLNQLLDEQRENPVAITAALRGAGGYGKTTLANAICHDDSIRQAFDDGILWVTLGENPIDLTVYLIDLIRLLTGEEHGFSTLDAARSYLKDVLEERDVLLVVDDVWKPEHLKPFLNLSKRCALLVTTRDEKTLPNEAVRVQLDAMDEAEAVQLLSMGIELLEQDFTLLHPLVKRLGKWPLLLKLANGVLQGRILRGQSFVDALRYVETALDKRGLTSFDARNSNDRNGAVSKTLNVTFELLRPEEYDRYQELAIFPDDVDIPLDVVAHLWRVTGNLSEFDTEELCEVLHSLSLLLRFDPASRLIRLHDVIRTYLITLIPDDGRNLSNLQEQFLDSYEQKDWTRLPTSEGYLWHQIAYHLTNANRREELHDLLLSPAWLEQKLVNTSANTLLADFNYIDDADIQLIASAIRLSAHIISKNKALFLGQLYGRILSHRDKNKTIIQILTNIRERMATPALMPLIPTLDQAGTSLKQVINVQAGFINALALSQKSRLVLASIGYDVRSVQRESDVTLVRRMLVEPTSRPLDNLRKYADLGAVKIYDLETGLEVRSFDLHNKAITALLVTPDEKYAFSASEDGSVKRWHSETGVVDHIYKSDTVPIRAAALSADGKTLICGNTNGTIFHWDVRTGELLNTIDEHEGAVEDLKFVDNNCIVSASRDKTLRVWSLQTGKCVQILRGHTGYVTSIAVSADGHRIYSGAWDKTVRIWNRDTGECLHIFQGHTREVACVAVTPDGSRLLSGARDNTIKAWDLQTYSEIETFMDHNYVTTLAIDHQGAFFVSGSYANTIRQWMIHTSDTSNSRRAHTNRVSAIAVESNGQRFITASWDGTLRLWDAQSFNPLMTFYGHKNAVLSTAFSPDGERVVSGGSDETIRVWETRTGTEILHIHRQEDYVNAVQITPDGRSIISGSRYATVRVWSLEDGSLIKTIGKHNRGIRALAVTKNGRIVVLTSGMEFPGVNRPGGSGRAALRQEMLQTVDRETRLEIFNYLTDEKEQTISEGDVIFCFACSPNETTLVTASWYEKIRVWDLHQGEVLRTLTGHTWIIEGICITTDGKLIFSVSQDHTVRVWESDTGKCISTFNLDENLTCCALLPDDRTIVVGGESGRIHFLRLEFSALD